MVMLLQQHAALHLHTLCTSRQQQSHAGRLYVSARCQCRPLQRHRPVHAAAAAVSTPFDTLRHWLTENGGNIGSITVGDCQMGDVTVRGLVATEDLPPETAIISVPVQSTLRDDKAAEVYPGAPWNANLAAQLLDEKSRGPSSTLWPYIQTLPASCCSPLLLPDNHLQEVQYAPAVKAIASYQTAVRAAYDQCCRARLQTGLQPFSWEDWAWAVHMVQSRSIRLAITGCKVMIPGIDLLNHGGVAANGQLVLGKASWQLAGDPAVCFVTTRHIAAGEQVLWSYGTRGNDDYFVYHGFALPNNPDEDIALFADVDQLVDWAIQRLPRLQPLREQRQQVAATAAAAATRSAQQAAASCPSAAIQGTSSSLLLPLQALLQQLQEPPSTLQLRQQQQWQQQLSNGSSSAGCEAAALAGTKYLKLQRRLASCRLHSPAWGTADCPPSIPELVLRRDGCIDVRLPAVLASLLDHATAAAGSTGNSNSTSSSSHMLSDALQQLVKQRCQELLDGFPSTVEQDMVFLKQMGNSEADWLMAAVVQYRLGKKELLQQLLQAI